MLETPVEAALTVGAEEGDDPKWGRAEVLASRTKSPLTCTVSSGKSLILVLVINCLVNSDTVICTSVLRHH